MNTTIYYFLIYIAEALICIQYTSNIFSDRFSHFKRDYEKKSVNNNLL